MARSQRISSQIAGGSDTNIEKAETDVRLGKAFTELMDIANGRGG
jgi:hypothetical protein